MSHKNTAVLFFATGFFTGYIPAAPGTFGTMPGLIIAFFIKDLSFFKSAIFISLFIIFSVWIAGKASIILEAKDPGQIVIDEMAGIIVTFAGIPFNFISAVAGFVIFRFLDILKPFPINALEKNFSGGLGIVIDDVAAGFIGNIILRIVFTISIFHGSV